MAKFLPGERAYESLFITPSDTSQKSIDAFVEKIKQALTPANGILNSVQVWGRRRLTFSIKHHKDGLYVFIDFKSGPTGVEALKNLFRVSDIVLRHMITEKVDLKPPFVRRPPPAEAAAAAAAASGPAAPPTHKEA